MIRFLLPLNRVSTPRNSSGKRQRPGLDHGTFFGARYFCCECSHKNSCYEMSMTLDCAVIFRGKIALVRCQCAFGLRKLAQSAANFASGSFFRGRRNSLKISAKHSPMFMCVSTPRACTKSGYALWGTPFSQDFFRTDVPLCYVHAHYTAQARTTYTARFCDAPPRRGIFSNFSRRMTLCEFL